MGNPTQPAMASKETPTVKNEQDRKGDLKIPKAVEEAITRFHFSEQTIRKAFIRKVYSILMCQLLVTVGFVAFFVFCPGIMNWVITNFKIWFWTAFGINFVVIIIITCFENARRTAPYNFIFLGIFTITMSFMVGGICSFCPPVEVMTAIGMTAFICLGLTLFAFQTRWDFTGLGACLVCFLMVLLTYGTMVTIIYTTNIYGGEEKRAIYQLLYSSLGALLFSFYLVYDTQRMIGGDYKYALSSEEYVFAALNLYLDIINIFVRILRTIY